MFPTQDRAGTIATRCAGVAEFRATLCGGPPGALVLPALPEGVRCSVAQTGDSEEGRLEILGEVRAFTGRDLGAAVETILRSLTVAAALREALLEACATRLSPPVATPAPTLEVLALDLRDAGFRVGFAPSWTAVREGGVALGVRGAEAELRAFLEAHPSWKTP